MIPTAKTQFILQSPQSSDSALLWKMAGEKQTSYEICQKLQNQSKYTWGSVCWSHQKCDWIILLEIYLFQTHQCMANEQTWCSWSANTNLLEQEPKDNCLHDHDVVSKLWNEKIIADKVKNMLRGNVTVPTKQVLLAHLLSAAAAVPPGKACRASRAQWLQQSRAVIAAKPATSVSSGVAMPWG